MSDVSSTAGQGKCPKIVSEGDVWHPKRTACGRPIKRRGRCGLHARGLDLDDARDAEYAAEKVEAERAARLAADLTKRYGVTFRSVAGYGRTSTIELTVDAAAELLGGSS